MREALTHKEISAVLRLNDGVLYWLVKRGKARPGFAAGRIDAQGYTSFEFKGHNLQAHRVVWLLTYGVWPKQMLDHIDGNRSNNDPSNLREVTNAQNQQNRRVSGVIPWKGVVLHRSGRFQATCARSYLGLYSTPEEAAVAYDNAARNKFGEFARLNFGGAQ